MDFLGFSRSESYKQLLVCSTRIHHNSCNAIGRILEFKLSQFWFVVKFIQTNSVQEYSVGFNQVRFIYDHLVFVNWFFYL
ncbi:hypothetical protein SAMN06264855_11015 [Halorubrum vacuolatum]|uniref:Uncharacterized protein n=1 Tax=Halorubrum vacuolatum TaxID=63740 RepID=A0A238WTI5_HALVU|nr:hypothetical protein SAMN06264855_11015 [Halorubrum vacuolatum]